MYRRMDCHRKRHFGQCDVRFAVFDVRGRFVRPRGVIVKYQGYAQHEYQNIRLGEEHRNAQRVGKVVGDKRQREKIRIVVVERDV